MVRREQKAHGYGAPIAAWLRLHASTKHGHLDREFVPQTGAAFAKLASLRIRTPTSAGSRRRIDASKL